MEDLWKQDLKSTTSQTTTTSTKSVPKTKSIKTKTTKSPNDALGALSPSDQQLLEAILKQQASAAGSPQDLEKVVQNQIRLAVRAIMQPLQCLFLK